MNGFKDTMYSAFTENNLIPPEYFDKYSVKRGLRNPDGTGVTEFEREFHLLGSIERLTHVVFDEVKHSGKAMCANIDMYSGFVYKMLGIPEELFTPLFAVSRMAGWCTHRYEEINSGKRIMRPVYKSISKEKQYVNIDNR